MGRTAVVALLIAVAALSACSGGDTTDGDVVVIRASSTVAPAPSGTAMAATTPTVTASPTPPPEISRTPVPASGSPFGGADLMAALAERGLAYGPQDWGAACARISYGSGYGTAGYGGPSEWPSFQLEVYASPDALTEDWEVAPGEQPRPRDEGCHPPDLVYQNQNLLLVFEDDRTWVGHEALRGRIVEAFETLTFTWMATPGPTGEPRAAPTHSGAVGAPFSASDVAGVVERDGQGYSFWLIDDRAPICPGSAVPGRPHWSANLAGSDFGPVFVLWVYPDVGALQQDWEVVPGEAPRARFDGCDLAHGFVYWNENLVIAFEVWLSLGEDVPLGGNGESPGDHPAVHAFLELAP